MTPKPMPTLTLYDAKGGSRTHVLSAIPTFTANKPWEDTVLLTYHPHNAKRTDEAVIPRWGGFMRRGTPLPARPVE